METSQTSHVAEFLGDVERVFDRRRAFQDLQILGFFGLPVPKAGVKIDILASNVAALDALAVDIGGKVLDFSDDFVEARGGDANGHVSRMSAAIALGCLFDVSDGPGDDGPDLRDGLPDIVYQQVERSIADDLAGRKRVRLEGSGSCSADFRVVLQTEAVITCPSLLFEIAYWRWGLGRLLPASQSQQRQHNQGGGGNLPSPLHMRPCD